MVAATAWDRAALGWRSKQGDGCLSREGAAEHEQGEKLMTIWFTEENNPPVQAADKWGSRCFL